MSGDPVSPSEQRKRDYFDLLHWVWSCDAMGKRLVESDASMWGALAKPEEPPPRVFSQVNLDEHLLLVTMRNLLRALDRVPEMKAALPIESETTKAICQLRDIYEHWDQYVDLHRAKAPFPFRSGKAFMASFPGQQPWSMEYGEKGPVLAGVVVLRDFFDLLGRFEPKVFEAWRLACAEGRAGQGSCSGGES